MQSLRQLTILKVCLSSTRYPERIALDVSTNQGFEITEPRSGFTVTTTNGEGSFALEATDYMDFGQSYVEVSLVSDAPTSNGRAYEIANVSFEGKVAAQDITLTISEFPAGTYSRSFMCYCDGAGLFLIEMSALYATEYMSYSSTGFPRN